MKNLALLLVLAGVAVGQDSRMRVFLTDHATWQQASTLVAGTYTGATRTEQEKSLSKACPAIVITADPQKAAFIVAWDSKTWQQTSWGGHENEFTIYNAQRDMVASGAAHHIKNAAKDICSALAKFTVASAAK